MEFTFRPIHQWPGSLNRSRKSSRFKASYSNTLAMLDRELRFLNASNLVLQVALTEEQIRLDGRPRAGVKTAHPGVILAFDSKHGPLSYPCDTFSDWEDNLRAIALSLEHLRSVDRYGVTRRGEQYRGWTQLPPPMTPQEATELFRRTAGGPPLTRENIDDAYRRAVLATHPDRGGDKDTFNRVQQAREVLEKSFNGTCPTRTKS